MRFRDVPIAQPRRFIALRRQMNTQIHFAQIVGEMKISRRAVDRICANHHQYFDTASADFPNKLAKRFQLIGGIGFDGGDVLDGFARIVQRVIHQVRQSMDHLGGYPRRVASDLIIHLLRTYLRSIEP